MQQHHEYSIDGHVFREDKDLREPLDWEDLWVQKAWKEKEDLWEMKDLLANLDL